jgi:tRNA(Leu) C34 or U34 (ribose-2'-O)-methylase TrmL
LTTLAILNQPFSSHQTNSPRAEIGRLSNQVAFRANDARATLFVTEIQPKPPPAFTPPRSARRDSIAMYDDSDSDSDIAYVRHVLRYMYPGSTPKNGRVIVLPAGTLGDGKYGDEDIDSEFCVALLKRDGVNVDRWRVRVYDNSLDGWRLLGVGITSLCWNHVGPSLRRCELQLEEKPQPASTSAMDALDLNTCRAPAVGEQNGYFGIGIYNGKNTQNLGTLWRSAYQLGAAFAFVIGRRFKKEASDTPKSWTQIPTFEYSDWDDFVRKSPVSAVWVGVEMGGTPLENFEHPRNAVYILGSEDTGLNTTMLRACQHHIALPTTGTRSPSFNVAVTGAIIMYDRELKRRAAAAKLAALPTQNRRDGVDSVKPLKSNASH